MSELMDFTAQRVHFNFTILKNNNLGGEDPRKECKT